MPSTDLNLLYVFEAMFKRQNVNEAAKAVGLSQSGMSHALDRLRKQFGDQLFVRTAQGMKPTPRAEQLAPGLLAALAQIESSLTEGASFEAATSSRTFTLILTDLGELTLLPRLLSEFAATAPGCRLRTLQVTSAAVAGLLESGRADVAAGHVVRPQEGLLQQSLGKYSFVCLFDKRLRPGRAKLTLEQFRAAEHIVVSLSGDIHDAYEQHVQGSLNVHRPNVRLVVPHWVVVAHLLPGTKLMATVPEPLAVAACAMYKSLAFSPCPVPVGEAHARQYWHSRYQADPANRWLRTVISRVFREKGAIIEMNLSAR